MGIIAMLKSKLPLDEIKNRLLIHEGFCSHPYRCTTNKLTIGIGRNIEQNPFTPSELEIVGKNFMTDGITKASALIILKGDIEKFESQIVKNIPFYENLDAERQYALLDMAFNMGIGSAKLGSGLMGFKNMLKNLGTGFYKEASKECLDSKYGRDKNLYNRSRRIAKTIETGVFSWNVE